MELGFKTGTTPKALELDLLAVWVKREDLEGPSPVRSLKNHGGERSTWRPTHSILAWEITWLGSLVIWLVRVVAKKSLNSNYKGFAPPGMWAAPATPETTCNGTRVRL